MYPHSASCQNCRKYDIFAPHFGHLVLFSAETLSQLLQKLRVPVGFQLGEGIQHAPGAEKARPLRPLLEKRKARLRRTALPFQFRLGANAVFADSLAQPVGDRANPVSQFAELAEIPAQFVRRQHRSDKVDEQREVGERQNPLSERGRK